jgi:4-cresol dehydrogenase (hydroxylating) flavoprotein subunit
MSDLPPGVTRRSMQSALKAFAAVVGPSHVRDDEQARGEYRDPFDFGLAERHVPFAVVRPACVGEVQSLLKVANARGVPLWTVSRGKNLGYGGPAPRLRGSVVLELSRMSRILEINDELCYGLFEPGVTFFDVYEHVRANKLKVWPSSPALGWGSVVGNTLERGWGYTPYGDHSNVQCGMEVVLANGDVVRTGMGALDGANTWPLFRGGYGPSFDGLFTQSNLGIVTKLGLWMMPEPEAYMSVKVKVAREEDLAPLIDRLAHLKRKDVLQNAPVVGNIVRYAAATAPRSRWFTGEGAMPDEVLERIRRELGGGWWDAYFSLYGSEEMIALRYKHVQSAFADLPRAEVTCRLYTAPPGGRLEPGEFAPEDGGGRAGVPGLAALGILKFRGADCGHLGFSPVLPARGADALKFYYKAKRRQAEFGFDYFGGFHTHARHVVHIAMIIFDKHDARHRHNARRLFEALVEDGREEGYSEYRAHLDFMDLVAEQYDFNAHASRRLSESLKDALDPNGILSPGKQGVWPARFRAEADRKA